METVRNVPITCPSCRVMVSGRETPSKRSDGTVVYECLWRCSRCGSQLKRGITRIQKNENK